MVDNPSKIGSEMTAVAQFCPDNGIGPLALQQYSRDEFQTLPGGLRVGTTTGLSNLTLTGIDESLDSLNTSHSLNYMPWDKPEGFSTRLGLQQQVGSSLNFQEKPILDRRESHTLGILGADGYAAHSSYNAETRISRAGWVSQLSDINDSLWKLTMALGALSEGGRNSNTKSSKSEDEVLPSPLDHVFGLSRALVQTLEGIGASNDVVGDAGHTPSFSQPPSECATDPGTWLLILSSHIRILDIYQKVFHVVQGDGLQQTPDGAFLTSDGAFLTYKLPSVSVGPFPVEPSQSLRIALTLRLAEDFLCKLIRATPSWTPRAYATGTVSVPDSGLSVQVSRAIDSTLQAVRAKEERVCIQLGEMRRRIELPKPV
jgi:hypothetical protein